MKLISISIPVLNEEKNIVALYDRLCQLAIRMQEKCALEFVFSDNCSNDHTWAILSDLAARDSRVKAIRFSKNYGFQRSIFMNYLHTKGDAVMQLDADLQDPPEMLEKFFDLWQQGYHVVYGIRTKRQENIFINGFRRFGYWVIDKISEHSIPRDAGDFRLLDRKIIQALSQMRTSTPYLRGMIAGVGFKQIGIPYEREARLAGKSKFNLAKLINLGLTAVFNHSYVPLRLASFIGGLVLIMSFVFSIYYILARFYHPDWPRGLASTYILILLSIGLNSFLLGIIGEYLLRIYLVIRNEPIAIIEDSLNFLSSELKT